MEVLELPLSLLHFKCVLILWFGFSDWEILNCPLFSPYLWIHASFYWDPLGCPRSTDCLHLIKLINGTFHIHHLPGCIFSHSSMQQKASAPLRASLAGATPTFSRPSLAIEIEIARQSLLFIPHTAFCCEFFVHGGIFFFFLAQINELRNSIENRWMQVNQFAWLR